MDALFIAVVDEDAAAVIREGVSCLLHDDAVPDWRQTHWSSRWSKPSTTIPSLTGSSPVWS